MRNYQFKILLFFSFALYNLLNSQTEIVFIKGVIKNEKTNDLIEDVAVKNSQSTLGTLSNKKGYFEVKSQKQSLIKLHFSHPGFYSFIKEIKSNSIDTVAIIVYLKEKTNLLDTMSVYAINKSETLVGKTNYSVYDFDFYEDKLILLTAEKSLRKAQIQFSDYSGNIITRLSLPKDAGKATSFFHDYEGYTDLICSDTVFRLDVMNNDFILMPINRNSFNTCIKPVIDTANQNLYYSNQWEKYPLFNYYFIKQNDSTNNLLSTVINSDLMKIYNWEYYYLKPGDQLQARRIAQQYKIDKHIVAALMSGFTQSMYYEPIYAPLFILNDTVCVFNHYSNFIYHFNKQNKIIDSVSINYHHPKNWREWKKLLYVDKFENKVYAFFSKNGHHYLKQINHQTGKEIMTYKLKHHSAEKIKIKDGYVYYVYRPFESTQEKFLYREKIE